MGGVPDWVLVVLGVLFAASLIQAVFFFFFGLKEAFRKSFLKKEEKK